MLLWTGHTRSILCVVYLCMALQNDIFLVRKLMLQDLYAFYSMTWNPEFLCSSLVCVTTFFFIHVISLYLSNDVYLLICI